MRIPGRSLALGIASVALSIGSLATPASADEPQTAAVTANAAAVGADGSGVGQVTTHKRGDGTKPPAELGNPSEWGVAKIGMDASVGSARPDQEACVNASGGKWCYGWYATPDGKYCYSNYYHYSKDHKSSVKIAGTLYSSGWVRANDTSNANATAGLAYTCYTYYSVE
ncbi:lactococcin 972 family bacteriocin [Streptomyces abikoensis]|uniref:lactococcin 972 family bacteriocin n=1 Tax=Streptomyces abikoensis TaxID=97398 RepID=UPI00368E41FC